MSAQVAANQQGARFLWRLVERHGWPAVASNMRRIQLAAEHKMRAALKKLPVRRGMALARTVDTLLRCSSPSSWMTRIASHGERDSHSSAAASSERQIDRLHEGFLFSLPVIPLAAQPPCRASHANHPSNR